MDASLTGLQAITGLGFGVFVAAHGLTVASAALSANYFSKLLVVRVIRA